MPSIPHSPNGSTNGGYKKASLNAESPKDRLREAAFHEVARHIQIDAINDVYYKSNRKGTYISVHSDEGEVKLFIKPASEADRAEADALKVSELSNYVFDINQIPVTAPALFTGFISRGDIVTWLGREKHRKSNLILELAIAAAVGRDFLRFPHATKKGLKVVIFDFESKTESLAQRKSGIVEAMKLSHSEMESLRRNLKIFEIRKIRKAGYHFPKFPHKPGDSEAAFWEELVRANPADLYIIDPMRSLHSADENDSAIEFMLSEIQRIFRNATTMMAHHMRKPDTTGITLAEDMRAWSEGARGSGAIKAHSDVIVMQERTIDKKGNEVVYLGAFQKDGPDIEPFPLMESDHESYFFEPIAVVPGWLRSAHRALDNADGLTQAEAVSLIIEQNEVSQATAYRHFDGLRHAGLLVREGELWRLKQ